MILFSKAVASNTDLETAQAFVFFQEDLSFIILLSASGDDVFARVRQLSGELQESFFAMEEPISERLKTLQGTIKENLKDAEDLQILLGSIKKSSQEGGSTILYILGEGREKAYLKRNEEIAPLFGEAQSGQLISGYLQNGDRLLFLNSFLEEKLQGAEGAFDKLFLSTLEDFEEEITSNLLEEKNSGPVAGILLEVEKEVLEIIENIEEEKRERPKLEPKKLLNIVSLRVRQAVPKSRRARGLAALFILGIIILGILFSIKSKGNSEKESQFLSYLKKSSNELSTAKSLKDLDTNQAKEALNKSNQDLSLALKINPNDSRALSLKKDIEGSKDDILKIYTVSSWSVFLDLNLVKNNFSPQTLSLSTGKLLLLDPNLKSLNLIDLQTKNNKVLAGQEQLGQVQFASLNGDFAFSYSSDKGVVRVDTQAAKASVVLKPDTDWGKIEDLYGFAGNIYLLDTIKNQIWKYVAASSGYSDQTPYLKSQASLAGAKRLLIDSSVWVLNGTDEIDRYTAGSSDSFSIGGLDKSIKKIESFFVSSETDYLYILDSGEGRVVIVKKNGEYIGQILGDKFKNARDLAVDEKNKKLYLLSGNKIYLVDLH